MFGNPLMTNEKNIPGVEDLKNCGINNTRVIDEFLDAAIARNKDAQLNLLKEKRKKLLKSLHSIQDNLECLDSIIRQIEKYS